MLTAQLGGLMSFPMNTDVNADGIIDDFWERLTNDGGRFLFAFFGALILGAIVFFTMPRGWKKLLAAPVFVLVFWVLWGMYNRFWAIDPEPLFILPFDVSLSAYDEMPYALAWAVPILVYLGLVVTRNKWKLPASQVVAVLAAAGAMFATVLIIGWAESLG
jgi:hypothetical protein